MGTLIFWTLVIIAYQTAICIVLSWLVLSCQLKPRESELRELSLIKLLYLYDPEACGRIYFYNFTRTCPVETSIIIWPMQNDVAARFRHKVRLWLAVHIIWLAFGVLYVSQGQKRCGMYATLVPFTLTGVAVLVMDVVYTALFLMDITKTNSELNILTYLSAKLEETRAISKVLGRTAPLTSPACPTSPGDDTSWISLSMAYISCRAVVQWVLNFWIIKDNYLAGLNFYRHLHKPQSRMYRLSYLSDVL